MTPKPKKERAWSKLLRGAREEARARGPLADRERLGTKAFLGAVAVAVVAGPASCVMGAAQRSAPQAAAAATPRPDHSVTQQAAAGAAVRFVRDWLTLAKGEEDGLLAQLADPRTVTLELPDRRPTPPKTVDPWTVENVDGQTWRVRVLVDALRAYDVYLTVAPDQPRSAAVLMLPSQVAHEGARRTTADQLEDLPLSHPAAATAAGFAKALLTGSEDVARWTAPQTAIAPVVPPACSEATLTQAQAEDTMPAAPGAEARGLVVITVRCGPRTATPTPGPAAAGPATPAPTPTGGARVLSYALQMAGRDGRWEVTGLTNRPYRPATTQATASPTHTTATPR